MYGIYVGMAAPIEFVPIYVGPSIDSKDKKDKN